MAYSAEQLNNARTILNIGRQLGASSNVLRASIATALVESRLRNLSGGDRDSAGVFQQRPSVKDSAGRPYWGTYAQVTNLAYSAARFFREAIAVERANPSLSIGALSQKVQRSAFPLRYGETLPEADRVIAQTTGGVLPGDSSDDEEVVTINVLGKVPAAAAGGVGLLLLLLAVMYVASD